MMFCGGEVMAGGASSDDRFEGIVIEGNLVDGYTAGLQVLAAMDERCGDGCGTAGSIVRQVYIKDNVWRNAATGIVLSAGLSLVSAATVAGNLLEDIVIERETIEAEETGVAIFGGFATNPSGIFLGVVIFPGNGLPAMVEANILQDVVLRDCSISAPSGTGIIISGGISADSEDVVMQNSVTDIFLEGNVVDSNYGVSLFGGLVVDEGEVRNCSIENVELLGNSNTDGGAVPESHLDQIAIGTASRTAFKTIMSPESSSMG